MFASLIAFPAPAMAAATFTGGPDTFPLYVPNDHTPFVLHYTVGAGAGLAPNTHYYVKVRFTVGTAPSGSTNRGWTWNPAGHKWVQERDNKPDWSNFPMVTTDASGRVPESDAWLVANFGDETVAGSYHLMVSLNSAGDNSTFNSSVVPTVTVFDPRTDGSWVHNGIAVASNTANKDVRLTDEASTTVLSLQRTEAQGVDDDANLVVDDEDYGPAGNLGDFRMSVPTTATVKVNLNQASWPSASSTFTPGPADTDIALGGSDMVAPSAPGALAVASGDGTAQVSWVPATDNTAVSGYYVYRWTPAPIGAAYSPVHARVATMSADATSYAATGLTNGTSYLFEVRAFDAATNVGPRSGPVTAAPQVTAPRWAVSPIDPDGLEDWYVTTPAVTLAASGPARTTMYSFEDTASAYATYTVPVAIPDGIRRLYFYDTDGSITSGTQWLDFKVDTGAPTAAVSVPSFSVLGSTTRSFAVSWTGTDTVSGIAAYNVDVKIGATGAWTSFRASTAATSAVFTGSAGSTYYFRVRSLDVAGNASGSMSSAGTVVPYDQSKASFSHYWSTVKRTSGYLGSAKYTTRSGAYSSFTLSKGTLYLVATTGPKFGKVKVYYRGHLVATIDTHSNTTKYRQVFKIATYAKGAKPSAVKLVNQATHGRPRLEIDGFALKW